MSTTSLFFTLALCTFTSAHAQVRKASLPADTGVLSPPPPIAPYVIPSKTDLPSPERVFGNPYQTPEYPGGTRAMYGFIESNLKIPEQAKKAGVSGRVFVSFDVQATGEITNVTVLKGLGFGCDSEAVRLVESMPKWKPGKESGRPIRTRYALPISFVTK